MREIKQIAYNRSIRNQQIKWIVIHDTGNKGRGADALAHYNYFNSGNRGSSADFFVDDKSVICVNDYMKYYTWHCGDGKGKFGITNQNSIGIEICINSDGDYDKAVANTVKLTKDLMVELNIPIERVIRHYDASRKNCPASMSSNKWALWHSFKKDLSKGGLTVNQYEELKQMIEDLNKKLEPIPVYKSVDDVPEWCRETIRRLHEDGHLKGDSNGLNLNYDMVRMLVILDRAGVFK